MIGVAEISKRNPFWGALLASLPLTSVLAFVWLHVATANTQQVAGLARGIFWLVTVGAYLALVWLLPRVGIQL